MAKTPVIFDRGAGYSYDPEIVGRPLPITFAQTEFPSKLYPFQKYKRIVDLFDKSCALQCWEGETFEYAQSSEETVDRYIPYVTAGYQFREREDNLDQLGQFPGLPERRRRKATIDQDLEIEEVLWKGYADQYFGEDVPGLLEWPVQPYTDIITNGWNKTTIMKSLAVTTTSDTGSEYYTDPSVINADLNNFLNSFRKPKIPIQGRVRNYVSPGVFQAFFKEDDNGRTQWDKVLKMNEGIQGMNFEWRIVDHFYGIDGYEADDKGIWIMMLVDICNPFIARYGSAGWAREFIDQLNFQTIGQMREALRFDMSHPFANAIMTDIHTFPIPP